MCPTELPASVSLIPMQNRPSPLAARGSQRSRMVSLPRCSMARGGPLKISWARIALDTSARASSSNTIAASMSPRPAPPHFSPIVMPNSSAFRMPSHAHCGNSSVSSPWRAIGASSCSATSRASWRSAAWSSVSAKGFVPVACAGMEPEDTEGGPAGVADRFRATFNLTTLSGMAGETQEEAGPSIEWLMAQPYEMWGETRRSECPVLTADAAEAMGRPGTFYQVTRYKDAESVLRDDKTFSSSINTEHIGQFMGDLILAMGGDEHRKYRNLVAKAFRASQLEQWDETLVRPTINRLIDAIAPFGRADLVQAITSKYPVQVICGIVGVPLDDA